MPNTYLKPMPSLSPTQTLPINVLVNGSTKFSIDGIYSTITSLFKLSQQFGAKAYNPSFSKDSCVYA